MIDQAYQNDLGRRILARAERIEVERKKKQKQSIIEIASTEKPADIIKQPVASARSRWRDAVKVKAESTGLPMSKAARLVNADQPALRKQVIAEANQ